MPSIELIFLNLGVAIILFLQTIQVRYLWRHESRIAEMESCLFGNPRDITDESLTERVIENHTMVKMINSKIDKLENKLDEIRTHQKKNGDL